MNRNLLFLIVLIVSSLSLQAWPPEDGIFPRTAHEEFIEQQLGYEVNFEHMEQDLVDIYLQAAILFPSYYYSVMAPYILLDYIGEEYYLDDLYSMLNPIEEE